MPKSKDDIGIIANLKSEDDTPVVIKTTGDTYQDSGKITFASKQKNPRYVIKAYRDSNNVSHEMAAEFKNYKYSTSDQEMIDELRKLVERGTCSIWEGEEPPQVIIEERLKQSRELANSRGIHELNNEYDEYNE